MSKLEEDIIEEYQRHGSVFKTARKLGISNISIVADVVSKIDQKEDKPDLSGCRHDGFGDPKLRDKLVARNLAIESWDNTRPEVAEARRSYEEGTHDMRTGRDGPWILLYLFPRLNKRPMPKYFSLSVEG